MAISADLEASVLELRAKHLKLVAAVEAYMGGSVQSSKSELDRARQELDELIDLETKTLLGQIKRARGAAPSILLDFSAGKYAAGDRHIQKFVPMHHLLSFGRTTGGGCFNSQGVWEWLPADTPRIDYDRATGKCLGLLIENESTNLLRDSRFPAGGLSGAAWGSGSGVDVTAGSLAPDGLPSALLTASKDNSQHITQTVVGGVSVGTTYTISAVLRFPGSRYGFQLALYDGSVSTYSGSVDSSAKLVKSLGGGWELHEFTFTVSSSMSSPQVRINGYSGPPVGAQVEVWYVQLEARETSSSFIPTAASAVVRAGDNPYVSLGKGFNAEDVAVYGAFRRRLYTYSAELFTLHVSGSSLYHDRCSLIDNTSSIQAEHRRSSGDINTLTVGGSVRSVEEFSAGVTLRPPYFGATFRSAGSSRTLTDASPRFNLLRIGYGWRGRIDGHIKKLFLHSDGVTLEQLQELTT